MRNGNRNLAFKPREINRFFEQYTMSGNDALKWLGVVTPRERMQAFYKILKFKGLLVFNGNRTAVLKRPNPQRKPP